MTIALILLLAVIGAVLGSFVATLGLRMTRTEQAILGRSRCDACARPLNWLETLPIIGFVQARAACSVCGARIDPLHLLGELGGALILPAAVLIAPLDRAPILSAAGYVLLASAIVDIRTQRLPDVFTAIIAALGLGLALETSLASAGIGLCAAAASLVVLEIVRRAFKRFTGRSGLGFGDVKLIAAVAIWLGLETPIAIALAAGAALVVVLTVRPANGRIAFGPAIAFSAFAVGLFVETAR